MHPSHRGSPVVGFRVAHVTRALMYLRPVLVCVSVRWMDSPIFDADMFGRAMGSAEDSYQLTEGRFGNISSILDADHNLAGIDCHHNAYGYLSPSFSYQVMI